MLPDRTSFPPSPTTVTSPLSSIIPWLGWKAISSRHPLLPVTFSLQLRPTHWPLQSSPRPSRLCMAHPVVPPWHNKILPSPSRPPESDRRRVDPPFPVHRLPLCEHPSRNSPVSGPHWCYRPAQRWNVHRRPAVCVKWRHHRHRHHSPPWWRRRSGSRAMNCAVESNRAVELCGRSYSTPVVMATRHLWNSKMKENSKIFPKNQKPNEDRWIWEEITKDNGNHFFNGHFSSVPDLNVINGGEALLGLEKDRRSTMGMGRPALFPLRQTNNDHGSAQPRQPSRIPLPPVLHFDIILMPNFKFSTKDSISSNKSAKNSQKL